jgi:hypothetical protein
MRRSVLALLAFALLAGCTNPALDGAVKGAADASGDADGKCPGAVGSHADYVLWDPATGGSQAFTASVSSEPSCAAPPEARLDHGLLALPSATRGRIDVVDVADGRTVGAVDGPEYEGQPFALWNGTVVSHHPDGFLLEPVGGGTARQVPLPTGPGSSGLAALDLWGPVAWITRNDADEWGLWHVGEACWLSPIAEVKGPDGRLPDTFLAGSDAWVVGASRGSSWAYRLADGHRTALDLAGHGAVVVDGDVAFVSFGDDALDGRAMERLVRYDLVTGQATDLSGWPHGFLAAASGGQVLVARYAGPAPTLEERAKAMPSGG